MESASQQQFQTPAAAAYRYVACADLPEVLIGAPPETVDAVTNAFINALLAAGWSYGHPEAEPGHVLTLGTVAFNADRTIRDLALGRMPAAQWTVASASAGIAGIQVAVPGGNPPQSGASYPAPISAAPIYAVAPRKRGIAPKVFVIIAALLVALFFAGSYFYKHSHWWVAGNLKLDGKSSLPGGGAEMTYKPRPHDYEHMVDKNGQLGPHDGAQWTLNHPTRHGESFVGIDHNIWSPQINTPANAEQWAQWKNRDYAGMAGHAVTYTKTTFAGRPAYVWDFTTAEGNWRHGVWVISRVHSYGFYCRAMYDDDIAAFKKQCFDALSTAVIHTNE